MSDTQLKDWIEHFLFGTRRLPATPPPQLKSVIMRMEAENVAWRDIVKNGGFTLQSYYVQGDLNALIDRLEKRLLDHCHDEEREDSSSTVAFKTSVVRRFAQHLEVLLARHHEHESSDLLFPEADTDDDRILQHFLKGTKFKDDGRPPVYKSAQFWGEIARRLLMHRRPFDEKNLAPVPATSSFQAERAALLYDVTSQARGSHWDDPAGMHLVPHSEHVDATHWQTDTLLEAFVVRHPSHPLSRSIRGIVKRAVDQMLNGKRPSVFRCAGEHVPADLDLFLDNIDAVHASVQKVPPLPDIPPKVVDVFHRLLVLAEKDGLWQTSRSSPSSSFASLSRCEPLLVTGTDLFLTMDRLDVAVRERQRMKRYCTTG